jgi:5S rRNA maturation endonuclease (ribonuclease M5)
VSRDDIIDANPIVDFVRNRGHELKRAGKNFVTNASPVTQHKRGHRPVMIYPENNSWFDHDLKLGGSVIDWVMHERRCDAAQAMRELSGNNGAPEIVATYDYADEGGNLIFQCVRSKPKDFWQRRPDGKGGWINNLQGVRRVLYHLPQVLAEERVVVTEGEKDADTLAKLGLTTTTNMGGAKKWRDEYSETLRGKDVIVMGDNDDDGRKHVAQVIGSLTRVARTIRHVILPAQFKDVSDYIASLPPETARDTIAKLIDEAPAAKVTVTSEPGDDDGQADLTSLTSSNLTPYPAPLSQAAFHGLAGQFIEQVLPYTESDEAGLLFQFLACSGNVIGRTAHMIADAAVHYCNNNIVLVGPTSIARKGTAWRHNLRVFRCVDEDWIRDCIKHGVSSGEGIIYHVRDPIEKTVPVKERNKFTGRYETVVEDPGVQDKRLMIVETEFASVLKVMERTASTVSVVFRHMWDGDDVLSTLTKNSPTRATGVHGSVLGHITVEEVRPLLTETEMANGFGNRFLWIAVHRKQELSENDELPAIGNLIPPLHKSIEFARTVGQLRRDEKARELWKAVYHDLSELKPGLFGLMIARGAPQVLRLSMQYALLDCSKFVCVEHLQAALECWRYSEDSARWVFQAGTGNRNADKILAALAAAGKKGLTKWRITAEVFSRHATKHDIDEALRLLHRLKLATCVIEKTGGRSAERWFYEPQKREVSEESDRSAHKSADTSLSSHISYSEHKDTSHSSPPPASENASSSESGTKVEKLAGDESGVGRL